MTPRVSAGAVATTAAPVAGASPKPDILFAAAITLGGFLLFLVQPLLGKAILPSFGGATGVWATALCFYQVLLLAGYAYAHFSTRLDPRSQAALHLGLLATSLLWLPILPSAGTASASGSSPAPQILWLLLGSIAGPYLILASTSPLLQSWIVRRESGRAPYRYYALSNAGSLAGLFAYPFLVEPWLDLRGQATIWAIGYIVYLTVSAAVAVRILRTGTGTGAARPPETCADEGMAPPAAPSSATGRERLAWFLLPLTGAALLLAITNQITMDVAAVPFLWILPLSIYLLSYILAFGGWYRRPLYGSLLGIALAAMAVNSAHGVGVPILLQTGVALISLFAATMVCHGELVLRAPALVRTRPSRGNASADSAERRNSADVTRFYLISAAGGAAGGAFVALIAPALFDSLWELPVFLVIPYVVYLGGVYGGVRRRMTATQRTLWWGGIGIVLSLATIAFILPIVRRADSTLTTVRNFYGVLRVIDEDQPPDPPQRKLLHGRILHGAQLLVPGAESLPTTYYTSDSGVAHAFALHPRRNERPLRIGVIGLGVGTVAALAQPADTIRFYELNPAVEAIARRYFSFLELAVTDVVNGDGRLALANDLRDAPDHGFDILVVDAFSSDAIPVHLLTREAAELYAAALRPGGSIALNITNRHLDLAPVVRGMGDAVALHGVRFQDGRGGGGASPSHWYLLTGDAAYLASLSRTEGASTDAGARPGISWTDDYSNLLRVLR